MMKAAFLCIFLALAIERIANTFFRKEPQGEVKYAGLAYLLIFTYNLSVLIALFEFIQLKSINIYISFFGFLLMLSGVFLRRSAIKALGANWSIHIKEIPNRQIVKTGPYKFLRHPYYLAVIFELIGIALFFNAFFALFLVVLVQLPLLLVRMRLEEKTLLSRHNTT